MTNLEIKKSVIKKIAKRLKGTEIKWLFGGSAGMLVQGVDVVPNDIDLVVAPQDHPKLKDIFGEWMVDGSNFKIDDAEGEILVFDFAKLRPEKCIFEGVEVWANNLEEEIRFYKSRTDKIEANKVKIAKMEVRLREKTEYRV